MSLNGLLLIDKPEGVTSHDIVAVARKVLKTKQIGHAGTLDPFATGLLVLVVGEGTKISDFVRDGNKKYIATGKLGVETDTLDYTGKVIKENPVNCSIEDISKAVLKAQGALELQVPHFSAVKVKGEKLYEKARKNEIFEPPTKIMTFFDVKVIETTNNSFMAEVSCKKGGYIRSWASFIGDDLGCGAHLSALRRTQSSQMKVEDAISFEDFQAIEDADQIEQNPSYIKIEDCLTDWPTVMIKDRDELLLKNGQISHSLNKRLIMQQKQAQETNEIIGIRVLSGETLQLLCILEARPNTRLKIRRNFKGS